MDIWRSNLDDLNKLLRKYTDRALNVVCVNIYLHSISDTERYERVTSCRKKQNFILEKCLPVQNFVSFKRNPNCNHSRLSAMCRIFLFQQYIEIKKHLCDGTGLLPGGYRTTAPLALSTNNSGNNSCTGKQNYFAF